MSQISNMAKTVTFSRYAVNILTKSLSDKDRSAVLLVGRHRKNDIKVTGGVQCSSLDKEPANIARIYFAEGDDVIGIATTKKGDIDDLLKHFDAFFDCLQLDEVLVTCVAHTGDGINISDVWSVTNSNEKQKVEFTVTDDVSLTDSVVGRTTFNIPLSFTIDEKGSWEVSLHNEIAKMVEDINNGSMVYHLESSKVLLGCEGCYGVEDNVTCDSLFKYIEEDEEGGRSSRKASKKSVRCLNLTGYTDMSGEGPPDGIPACSPIVTYKTETVQKVTTVLDIDVVTLLDPTTPVTGVAQSICNSVTHQLHAMEECIRQFSKDSTFVTPVPYHYQPLGLPTLVTVIHPHSVPDEQLKSHRGHLHNTLCLPDDRPLFRRSNRFVFPGTEDNSGYLVNIHEGVSTTKVVGGTQSLVSGFYTYHHYMQDRFDDNKWGCAYRSLQTLVSWFKLQGYTNRDVPTHREIQQTLVDIGDKEPKFVGSRQWIGSMEVSFVLDTLLGVSCKILSVSCGADMASKGRELASHFKIQGTPVMIGGGVLAHTILGVDYDEVTGNIAFLILDPHYTGSEDKKVILDKGWCGWKGPDFWDKHAHYNMCLPQRPNVI